MKYTATLSPVQVGQAVKALVLLGEKKNDRRNRKGPFRRHHNNRNGPFQKG